MLSRDSLPARRAEVRSSAELDGGAMLVKSDLDVEDNGYWITVTRCGTKLPLTSRFYRYATQFCMRCLKDQDVSW